MKNSKKLFLIILSVLTAALISCNKVTAIPTFKVSDIAGTWSGDRVVFTIYNNGYAKMITPSEASFQIPEADWDSEKTEYTIKGDDLGVTELSGASISITFTSASTGTATSSAGTTDINKAQ